MANWVAIGAAIFCQLAACGTSTGNDSQPGGGSAGSSGSSGGASSGGQSPGSPSTSGGPDDGGSSGDVPVDAAAADSGPPGQSGVACGQIASLAAAYKTAHPGNGGKDWDLNAKTDAEIAADPAAQKLLSICPPHSRPVIPTIAWEYGGADHPWINPGASAVAYCVYTPVATSGANWSYDKAKDHILADVYVACPDQNPCKDRVGAEQVSGCMGDATNFEIFVDTASLRDGADAGLLLANSSTDLNLILPAGTKVHLYTGL